MKIKKKFKNNITSNYLFLIKDLILKLKEKIGYIFTNKWSAAPIPMAFEITAAKKS